MRVGKIEFGVYKKVSVADYFEISKENPICGCTIITLSIFYLTILRNECYTQRNKKYIED